jgi:hypothetical protein
MEYRYTGKYTEKLESLKNKSNEYFNKNFKSEEAKENENVRIKSSLLDLINEAKESEVHTLYIEIKQNVITYLCEVSGHSGDLEILMDHVPSVLSPEEVEYIIHNSALSRWF